MIKRRPTKTLLSTMNFLRAAGEAMIEDICVAVEVKDASVFQKTIRRWVSDDSGIVISRYVKAESGGRPHPVYSLSEKAIAMLDDVPQKAPNNGRINSDAVKRITEDADIREFVLLNHDVVPHLDLARNLGVSLRTIDKSLQALGLPIGDTGKHPAAQEISTSLGEIPLRSKMTEWLGGTKIVMPSGCSGIKSITRHFAGA